MPTRKKVAKPNLWVRDALERVGHSQRSLATAWGISEGAVSR